MPTRTYRDLDAWQVAMELVVATYPVAQRLPKHETYGLASQLRRASVSIPANIAEGYGRLHRGDYVRHLSIALGSVRELETLFEIVVRLGYQEARELGPASALVDRLGRLLRRLTASLQPRTPGKDS